MENWYVLVILMNGFVSEEMVCGSENSSMFRDYEMLKDDMLQRPVIVYKVPASLGSSTSDPFEIFVDMFLKEVVDIDQIQQFMTIVCVLDMRWRHKGLTWDPDFYGGLKSLFVDASDMWIPQVTLWIGNKESVSFPFQDTLTINSSGHVHSGVLTYVSFRCSIDVRSFPFDKQRCYFGFIHQDTKLNLGWTTFHLKNSTNLEDGDKNDPYGIHGEWSLVNFTVGCKTFEVLDDFCYFELTVRRQRLYYVIVVIFPLVLTSVMIPLVFLIPEKSGEKISYMVTIFTSTAIFLSYISNVMPKGLSSTPYLAILLTEVFIEGFCATLAALWVLTKYEDNCMMIKQKLERGSTEITRLTVSDDQGVISDNKKMEVEKMAQETPKPSYNKSNDDVNFGICLTRCQLDFTFLCSFMTGQIVFLTCLLFGTDWID
ncbi:acetylcholine receptor subunit alpha-like 1 [Biomphalaria pfeifferi]|uniref:Acetylcholine receptor subunit alpha-like 1 n=1 Tax=Biomphalaria pfeifferi TaxID=112525 RepID=A0AAD8F689_BIOPF|nr:acetylcholine receptor subunit alpha-like 1 [Biomphalaria pfeifferi]